ncbi:hypothetical protein [Streptomyces minutiscleroticus]|uniref:hypothetical protein n=1 Tax=Streptomyces minutiscleroticus TaxID=68238 RepID=UPI003324BD56
MRLPKPGNPAAAAVTLAATALVLAPVPAPAAAPGTARTTAAPTRPAARTQPAAPAKPIPQATAVRAAPVAPGRATAARAAPTAPVPPAADPPAPTARTAQASPLLAAEYVPTCGDVGDAVDPGSRDFPLRARLRGGPDAYEAGGEPVAWSLDLTNTTRTACGNIHPVLVLVDEARTLRPEQLRVEFTADGRTHPVFFERTDRDENVGVFDDGFPGFTVAPGETVTVPVRMAVASGTVPGEVVASAAVVQRREDDGDWVGESGDHRFRVVDEVPDREPGDAPGRPGDVPPSADGLARTGGPAPRALLGTATAALALLAAGTLLVRRARR